MPTIIEPEVGRARAKEQTKTPCYHCGVPCITSHIKADEHVFCCEGCKLVYEVLNSNGLCDYYQLQNHPGLSQIKPLRDDKYAYLDNADIAQRLLQFTDGDNCIVTLYIPSIHCSSCLWLLENLHRLRSGIAKSRVNFTSKEVTIHFSKEEVSLRQVVELLATIGYEPYISLTDTDKKATNNFTRQRLYKLGIAGFCFGNIMMMSFPEYLSFTGIEAQYAHLFRYLNLILALPVFFYSATEFFFTAWKGLQQKTLNIDAPIALAIIITFSRSIFEILSNSGAGYLDSMSGIVFFMLVGRVVQERAYRSISFNRDYQSYFPIAVTVLRPNGKESVLLGSLKEKDIVELHNDEIIPADAVVRNGNALIDYSFVTGESEPVKVNLGQMVYAGGKQVGAGLTIEILKPVAGSYLTSLWSHYTFTQNKAERNDRTSSIHILSKYFTWILLSLATITAIYWGFNDSTKIINSVTAMLIVACPCALLLSATFTNGNLLRIFSDNGLFLRDTTVIEQLGKIKHIVFDKTGTITQKSDNTVGVSGHQLTEGEKNLLYTVVGHSQHPLSKALAVWLGQRPAIEGITHWKETPGKGVEAQYGQNHIVVGSAKYAGISSPEQAADNASVYVRINNRTTGFHFSPVFRQEIPTIIAHLKRKYKLSLLSGDNSRQKTMVSALFGEPSALLFEQSPMDKLTYVEGLQKKGDNVLMIGDGLNDAGALQQSNVGITLADDINNFTPSCDAILDAKKFSLLPSILGLARTGKHIIHLSFAISILYNLAGLYFAMQGTLQPMMAAILMPCSTLTIVLITSGVSSIAAKAAGLSLSKGQ